MLRVYYANLLKLLVTSEGYSGELGRVPSFDKTGELGKMFLL
jgi:hypothetical protein